MIRIVSWNLLHLAGASVPEIVALIERERPGLLLMQEATKEIDRLPAVAGGFYARCRCPTAAMAWPCGRRNRPPVRR